MSLRTLLILGIATYCVCSAQIRGEESKPTDEPSARVFVDGSAASAPTDAALVGWVSPVIGEVAPPSEQHVIHSYFNTCPESPDGRHVLYFTSDRRNGEFGDLHVRERSSGEVTVIARGITAEDAHRAACQQWSNGGKTIVFHDCRDGRWMVIAVDLAMLEQRVLAEDRQVGFGSASGRWVPMYGCHWNPGVHRDLELVDVVTGEVRTAVRVEHVISKYGDWVHNAFQSDEISIFFPVMSPNEKRVFFKLSKPSGGTDFRKSSASVRLGKVVYDLEHDRFERLIEQWGHPSWSPDGATIFEKGNITFDVSTGKTTRYARSCFSDHPSMSPDGRTFVTDADVTKRSFGKPGYWAIGVGSMTEDEFVVLDVFDNSRGAESWRHNHPHPVFSADGQRVYFNVNSGPWTRLMVAEAREDSEAE